MKELAIGAIVRALLQLASGAGIVLASDAATQIASGLVALGTLVWSLIQKKRSQE